MKAWYKKIRSELILEIHNYAIEYYGDTSYMTPREYSDFKRIVFNVCSEMMGCGRYEYRLLTGINISYSYTGTKLSTNELMLIKEITKSAPHLEFKTYIKNKLK